MKKEQIKKEALNTNYVKPNAQAIISKIDDIAIGDNKGSNQRISTTNLIIASIKKGDFVLEYKKKKTNKLVKFSTLNTVNNEDFRGFIESFKIQLGVNNLPTWQNKTDEGKARMRILRDVFIVALPLIKADAIDTDDKGKSLTGANDSKLLLKGAFVKEKDIKRARDRALEIIDFVDLIEKRHHFAKELSTGQRKRLEMARAMAIDPKLLLMDEVTGGVDQKTIPGLVELVKKLKKTGVTIITIEHNINIIMEISDNVLALDQGKRIAFGEPKEIQNNKQVIDAYLGTFDAA